MKKILQGITCVFIVLLLVGCNKDVELKDGNEVLVSFENAKLNISVNELYNELKDQYGTSLLVEMIDEKILNLVYPTDDVANALMDSQMETYETYYGGTEKLLETLQSAGYETIDEFKETLLLNYKRELALKDYVRNSLEDSEIEKYYNNNIFGDITASHILIAYEEKDSMTDEEKREAEEKLNNTLEEIYKKLEDGEDFHELAKIYSDDEATATNGGRLGSFNKGEMESEFEKAAMNLEINKYNTQAIKTKYGYHIIYKEAEKDKPALETVKQTIIDNLIDEKIKENTKLQYEALIELRKSYGIVINDESLNSQYDIAVNNWLYGEE